MNNSPIRHGDWHVIDGHLVDLSPSPPPEFSDSPEDATGKDAPGNDASGIFPSPDASLPPVSPAKRRTNKSSPED